MVFSFSWDDCNTQDKLETKAMLNVRLGELDKQGVLP